MSKITKKGKCGKCGSTDFTLSELLGWKGSVEENELVLKNKNNGIESIDCDKCQTSYTEEDFTEQGIKMNFQ